MSLTDYLPIAIMFGIAVGFAVMSLVLMVSSAMGRGSLFLGSPGGFSSVRLGVGGDRGREG